VAGQPVRRRRAPLTRGLNRNNNRVLKDVFKGAATAPSQNQKKRQAGCVPSLR